MAAAQEKPTPTVLKKIKVENWSSFLLQKLYHCYTQKKHCDFTLKMVDGDLKVHRIVMNACSNYFLQINLENSHTVTLPPELKKELMEPIVNFIYSGILSFKTNIQKDLVRASKILKIDILTKLIDTDDISDSKAFINKTIPFEDAHMKDRHFLSSSLKESPSTPPLKSALKSTPPSSVIKSTGSSLSTPCTPSTSGVGKMAMKKLPFWKKRSTTPGKAADWSSLSSAPSSFSGSQSGGAARAEEEADVKPSRFELPEDSSPNSSYFYVPNFDNPLSYESESIVKPDERILKRVTESVPESVAERKKLRLTPPPLIKSVVEDEAALLSDEETPASPAPVRTATPKPILKTDKLDSARKKSVRFSTPADEGPAHTIPREQSSTHAATEEDSGSVHTTDADETNMITTKIITIKQELEEQSPSLAPPPSLSENGNIHVSLNRPKDLASIDPNHAKIIEEVLLKYPDLVHGNRNFKLKVVNSDNQIINYIMNNKTKCVVPGGGRAAKKRPVVGTAGRVVAGDNGSLVTVPLQISPKGSGDPAALKSDGRSFECKYCGPDLVDPPLATYHAWRVHMTRVHGERFDVRMCEYCGIKLSKRNLYMYHLRRVHNVRSDAMQFPECAFCSYIALSTNLLYKHCKNVHNKMIGHVCPTCNTMFETHDRLADHLSLTDHGNEKSHKCPHCRKSFDRSVNLKAHVRTSHGEKSAKSEEGASRPGGQEESVESSLGKASSSVVKKEMVTVKEEQSEGVEAYDGYGGGGGYIEVPVMQSSAYGTLVLPGGVTIIDTNNARMAETSSGEIGMESALVTSSEAMLEGTAVEPNEAVLGTNECGQTVLILNGTQQYILEQQPDGRLILPDILANNCVISYADDGSSGGGDYEIINVEQAQQEVMMSGQGILVSQGEVQDPGEGGAGPTMYGSHAGESILDSQDPHAGAPTTLVLSGGPYTPSLLGAHAMSSPLIQTVITTAGGHALGSGVIQSINSSGNILHPGSDSLLTSHNESIMTSQSDSTVLPSSGLTESAPPLTEQDSDPLCSEDPANHASGIVFSTDHSTNGMVYSTDHSQAGAVYSADQSQGGTLYSTNHSNNGTVYSNNHSPSVPLSIPSASQAVRTDTPPTAMELSETGDYQDGYESEGRMVIDTPSDVDGIVESESYEEDSPGRVESEPNNPSQEVGGGVVADASDVQEASHERSESQPSGPELQERLSEGDVSNDSAHISPVSDAKESVPSKAVPSISPLATLGGQVMENSESVVEGATENCDVTESADKAAEIAEQAAETVENIQTFLQAKTTGAAVQAKIQAIEEDWGDTLEDEEEEEEEETQIGPCRGQF